MHTILIIILLSLLNFILPLNIELSKENDYKNIIIRGYQTILLNIITTLKNITNDAQLLKDISNLPIKELNKFKNKVTKLKFKLKNKQFQNKKSKNNVSKNFSAIIQNMENLKNDAKNLKLLYEDYKNKK